MSTERLSYSERTAIQERGRQFINRIKGTNPVPSEVYTPGDSIAALYYGYLPDDVQDITRQVNALQQKYADAAPGETSFTFASEPYTLRVYAHFDFGADLFPEKHRSFRGRYDATFRITVPSTDSKTMYVPNGSTPYISPEHPHYAALRQYAANHIRLATVVSNALATFEAISRHCRTPGQWNLVFPQFTTLLKASMQEVMRNQRGRSTWPKRLPRDIKDAIPPVANLLAKCALLPDYTPPEVMRVMTVSRVSE